MAQVFVKQKKPHYRLKFLNKRTEEHGEIGAAWLNEDQSISIVLNPLVVVPQSSDLVMTLFPVNGDHKWTRRKQNNLPLPAPTTVSPEPPPTT